MHFEACVINSVKLPSNQKASVVFLNRPDPKLYIIYFIIITYKKFPRKFEPYQILDGFLDSDRDLSFGGTLFSTNLINMYQMYLPLKGYICILCFFPI